MGNMMNPSHTITRRAFGTFTLLSAAALAVPALAQSAKGLTKITAAETPGLPAAFLNFGVNKGMFKEEGLDLSVTTLPGGAQQITAALSGDVQFTGGDVVAFTTFRSRGIPVKIVRPGSGSSGDARSDYMGLIAGPNSSINKPEDLAGRQIGVNELNNIGAIMSIVALEKHGVAITSTRWAEIPLPNIMAAIETGQIDAGYAIEPFISLAKARGFKGVLFQAAEYGDRTQVGLSLTTEAFLASNPETVAAFQRAHKKTGAYAMAHQDEYRAALIEIASLKPDVAAQLRLPTYFEDVNRETIERVAADMVRLKLIPQVPDLNAFYAPA
jgi:NitT/TauT family transport system substrate-binding protein